MTRDLSVIFPLLFTTKAVGVISAPCSLKQEGSLWQDAVGLTAGPPVPPSPSLPVAVCHSSNAPLPLLGVPGPVATCKNYCLGHKEKCSKCSQHSSGDIHNQKVSSLSWGGKIHFFLKKAFACRWSEQHPSRWANARFIFQIQVE